MHNAWGSYPIVLRTLTLWSLSSVCWWNANRFFLVLCAIMKLCRALGLFGTILSFGSLTSFFLSVSMDISFLDVSFWISSKWWFIHLVSFLRLVFLCLSVSVLESLEHAYLLLVVSLACFLSLTQYIGGTPPSLKLNEMCMKFIFISICTYLCGVCPMCCWFSNSLVPMSLGTILFVLLF